MHDLHYLVHCVQMRKPEMVVVEHFQELVEVLARLTTQYGPVELLYRVN